MSDNPHIHSEIIKCWADGAMIQYYDVDQLMWTDCRDNHPSWNVSVKYRVKPSRLKVTVYVSEMSTSMHGEIDIALRGSLQHTVNSYIGNHISKLELEFEGTKIVSAMVL